MYELNEYGKQVWRNKTNKYIFAELSYRWLTRVVFIDESDGTRTIILDTDLSKIDMNEWEPMTKEIYNKVRRNFSEGYF